MSKSNDIQEEKESNITIDTYYNKNKDEILKDKSELINFINEYKQNHNLYWSLKIILEEKPMYLEHILTELDYNYPYLNDLIEIAISKNGLALQFIQKNKIYDYLEEEAINSNYKALKYTNNLKNNLHFIKDKYNDKPDILNYANDQIKNDGYFKKDINYKDFLDCDNQNANFTNTLGTCWMAVILTIFIFGDLTRNILQNELNYINPDELITRSKEHLKYLIPFGFDNDDIIPIFRYLLNKFINLLKDELNNKMTQNIDNFNNNSSSSNSANIYDTNEKKLHNYFMNIFAESISDNFGCTNFTFNLDGSYFYKDLNLSNLLGILFLNKKIFIFKQSLDQLINNEKKIKIELDYALFNINSSTTIGHELSLEYSKDRGHAIGFFKCHNKLKLVDNHQIINFNYFNFLNDYIGFINQNIEFRLCTCTNYDDDYKGFVIIKGNDIRFYNEEIVIKKKIVYSFEDTYNTNQDVKKDEIDLFEQDEIILTPKKIEYINNFNISNKTNINLKVKIINKEKKSGFLLAYTKKGKEEELISKSNLNKDGFFYLSINSNKENEEDVIFKYYDEINKKLYDLFYINYDIIQDESNKVYELSNCKLTGISTFKINYNLEIEKKKKIFKNFKSTLFKNSIKSNDFELFNELLLDYTDYLKKNNINRDNLDKRFVDKIEEILKGGYNKYSFKIKYK